MSETKFPASAATMQGSSKKNSDEMFLVIEGRLSLELEGRSLEHYLGQLLTVPQTARQRTRPAGARAAIRFELAQTETVSI